MFEKLLRRFRVPKQPEQLINQRQENFVNQCKHPLSIGQQIDVICKEYPYDWWRRLPSEITVLASPELNPRPKGNMTIIIFGQDCESYALGRNGIMSNLPLWFSEITDPRQGDIALYERKTSVQGVTDFPHVGICQEDGSVISRWGGGGPILKHPMNFVPTCYGDKVHFFRLTEEQLKKCSFKKQI